MTLQHHTSRNTALLLLATLLFTLHIAAAAPLASADDYFHGGAMHYLTNNIPAALDVVTNGLQKFPNDEKLRKLEELLKQQQQNEDQQQKQDQKDQQDQQQKQDQKNSDQQQEQKQKDEQSKNDDKQQQEQQKDDQKKADQQKPQPKPGEKKDSGDQQRASANPERPEQMTPEQAMRVLDSMKGDERVMPFQQIETPPASNQKIKDW